MSTARKIVDLDSFRDALKPKGGGGDVDLFAVMAAMAVELVDEAEGATLQNLFDGLLQEAGTEVDRVRYHNARTIASVVVAAFKASR